MNIPDEIKKFEPFWGTWHIEGMIGKGGFGSVYKIKREEFGETHYCALKHIQIPQSDDEIYQMTEEGADEETLKSYFKSVVGDIYGEIRLIAKLKGTSHIVSYEDHQIIPRENQIGYDIFIRMEYLTELNKYIFSNNITKADIIKLGIDLCIGLELCQKYNIIHRDIKPSNIFVSPNGDFKLGDFGISRQIEKTMTGLSRKGTINYMAPEVYKGEKYNSSVDIYSIGLVMYRYLNNNRMPFMPPYPEKFTSADRERAFDARLSDKPLPLPQRGKGRLAEIVLKACSYDMRDRYSSPAQMRMELEKLKNTKEEKEIINLSKEIIKPDPKQAGKPKQPYEYESDSSDSVEQIIEPGKIAEEPVNTYSSVLTEYDLPKQKIKKEKSKKSKKLFPLKIAGTAAALALIFIAVFIMLIYNNKNNINITENENALEAVENIITISDDDEAINYESSENYIEQPTEQITEPAISDTTAAITTTAEITTTAAMTTADATKIIPETQPTLQDIETNLNGYHEQIYSNGDIYYGNFVNGVRSGQGTYTWASTGIIYIGEFVNGEPNGNGSYVYPTENPTVAPTTAAQITQAATQPPTTAALTQKPTQAQATAAPTQKPTQAPTQRPTQAPTAAPTQKPTQAPTQKPTQTPTQAPTQKPTQPPTQALTQPPATAAPTTEPPTSPPVTIIKIKGKEYRTDLTYLDLTGQKLTNADIAPLEFMINLTGLDLKDNQITDISVLKGLVNLEFVDLGNNQINDMDPLKNLINLTGFRLHNNQISDISALENLTKLSWMDVGGNQIKDISPLKKLTNLNALYYWDNQVSDISVLKGLTNLRTLHLGNNKINDISALKSLTKLTELSLSSNQIKDVSSLKNLTNLTMLWLDNNQISDVTALKDLISLTMLNVGGNQIKDISSLKNLTNLGKLEFWRNQISDIGALKSMTNLVSLSCWGNQINYISSLKGLTNLSFIDLCGNQINSISALENLSNLKTLYLNWNQINDISALKNLINLKDLDLSHNQINDVNALKSLTNLKMLWIRDNQINETQITELKAALPNCRIETMNDR